MQRVRDSYRTAARALCAVVVTNILFVTVAIATAPPERRPVLTLVGVLSANAALIVLLLWLARSVANGRRILGAIGLLMFLLFSHMIAVLISLTTTYYGGPPLIVTHGALLTALVMALVFAVRAQMHRDSTRTS